MQFAVGPNRSEIIEVHCGDFRHERVWEFEGVARIDPHARSPFTVQVGVTASNLRGRWSRSFEQKFTCTVVKAEELINLREGAFHVEIPMAKQFKGALENNMERVDFVRVDEDGDDVDDTD